MKKLSIGFLFGFIALPLIAAMPTTLNTNHFGPGGVLFIKPSSIVTNMQATTASDGGSALTFRAGGAAVGNWLQYDNGSFTISDITAGGRDVIDYDHASGNTSIGGGLAFNGILGDAAGNFFFDSLDLTIVGNVSAPDFIEDGATLETKYLLVSPPAGAPVDGQYSRWFGGVQTWSFDGSTLESINASELDSGFVPAARVAGQSYALGNTSISNILTVIGTSNATITLGNTNNAFAVSSMATNPTVSFTNNMASKPATGLWYAHTNLEAGIVTWLQITNGTSGQVLTANGTGNAPSFQAAPSGGGGGGSMVEEFFNTPSSTTIPYGIFGLLRAVNGTASASASGTSTATAPGVVAFSTGTTTTGNAVLYSGIESITFGSIAFTNTFRWMTPVLYDATDPAVTRIGFGDSITGLAATDGAYMRYSTNDTHFVFVTASGGVLSTVTNTTTINAGQWYVVKITVNAAATSATMTVDGADAVTLTSNIPGTTQQLGIWNAIRKDGTGALSRTNMLDYIQIDYVR